MAPLPDENHRLRGRPRPVISPSPRGPYSLAASLERHPTVTRLAALFVFSVCACGAPSPDNASVERTEHDAFQLHVSPDADALRRGRNTLVVRAWKRDGGPARLESVSAMMPSHDHDPVSAVVVPSGDSARVDDLTLPMPGRWQITLRVGDGTSSDAAIWWVYIP